LSTTVVITPLVTLADWTTVRSVLESLLAVHSTDGAVAALRGDCWLDGHGHIALAQVAPIRAHLVPRLAVHGAGCTEGPPRRGARATPTDLAAEGVLLPPVRAAAVAVTHRRAVGLRWELRGSVPPGLASPAGDVGRELGGGVSSGPAPRGQLSGRWGNVRRQLGRDSWDVRWELSRGTWDVRWDLDWLPRLAGAIMVMMSAAVVLSPVGDEPPTTPLASTGSTLLGTLTLVTPVRALDEPMGAVHRAGYLCGTLRSCGGVGRPPPPVLGRGAHAHLAAKAVLGETIRAFLEAAVGGTLDALPARLPTPGAAGCACPPLRGLTLTGDAVVHAHDVLLASGAGRGAVDGWAVWVEGYAGADGAVVLHDEAVGAALVAGAGGGRAGS
jgi:hypothetical protein